MLITCMSFHILFYILEPTFFFMNPNDISSTVKLYVIGQQALTFLVVQLTLMVLDVPYRVWKNKKLRALSDQRYAFRNNQGMLHKLVESQHYPVDIRMQGLLRIWSFVLFYSFYLPYIALCVMIAFAIVFWFEKRNLYRHYSIHQKVGIKLTT